MKDDHLFSPLSHSSHEANLAMCCDAHETVFVQCVILYTHIWISEAINTVVDILHSFLLKNYPTVVFQVLINFYNVQFCSMIW